MSVAMQVERLLQGCHVKEVAAPSKVEPAYASVTWSGLRDLTTAISLTDLPARILRLRLATHHNFREVTPNVFANNCNSSALDKDKPSSTLFDEYTYLIVIQLIPEPPH
ncbi:hypothetical protein GGX14DRAFT_575384 [Mycena pura]|uniref:Uncharacterized protein n=1 Tax=Mycena pura TaxID=153505 RepID=A0AAD6UVT0_9AGAR|nr:hypothetical protein GGX14DRAFT_575384 [Mycena pura]